MSRVLYLLLALLALLPGCRGTRSQFVALAPEDCPPRSTVTPAISVGPPPEIMQVEHSPPATSDAAPSFAESPAIHTAKEDGRSVAVPNPQGLGLMELTEQAYRTNPALAQAEARVRAARGEWLQAGLPPNPTTGYLASEMGNEGAAGQQGTFAGQEVVTAGKLDKNRAIAAAELTRAEQLLQATRRRIETDVRVAFYQALIAERRVAMAEQLGQIGDDAASTSMQLLEVGDISRAALLQSELEQQTARLAMQTATISHQQAWRTLAAVIGDPDLPMVPLEGSTDQLPPTLEWEEQLQRIARESPEVAMAIAQAERARRVVARECVEAVPNIDMQVSVQYDNATSDTVAGVQAGVTLPIWNRNQGGIRRAQAEVTQAERNVDRVALDLQQRLSETFREYSDALARAITYRTEILPRAEETLDIVRKGYPVDLGYLDLLTAQRGYSQAQLAYLDALGELWSSWARIDGMLLDGSLSTSMEEIERVDF